MNNKLLLVLAALLVTTACAQKEEAVMVSGVHLDALDREMRPQDDFYQFANGGWLDSTEIPEIYSGYTVYHEVRERVDESLRTIIEDAAKGDNLPGSEAQQVGDLYSTWMDTETIDALGIEPVQDLLDAVRSIESTDALSRTMARLARESIDVPFNVSFYADLKASSINAVYLGQGGITMPNRDYYIETDNDNFARAREQLPRYIARLLLRAGVDADAADAAAADVYALEEAIATAQWDSVRNRDPQLIYNPYATDELVQLGDNMPWDDVLSDLGLASAGKIIIQQPSYFEALDQILADTPMETWRNYLVFRVLDDAAIALDDTTAMIRFDYRNRVLSGQEEQQPRWKRGITLVNALVGEAVGKLYVEQHFPPAAKAKMEELVANVIATLEISIDELEWMSPETRVKARDKLSKFTPKIGYPDVWKDYSTLQIIAGDNVGNMRRAAEWNYQQDLDKLGKPVDKNEWHMNPQTVNAYYSPTQNEIVFPAARLQPPFFQLNADDAINYGAVGGVIGHEISHGFDDKGSQFDGDGNLSNWWTEEDRVAFEERTKVLVQQFNKFSPVDGMYVNGELTLGENIGDLSGVAMAYRAYIRSLNGKEAPVIDGFTGAQRFFIGYAMSRKGKYTDEALISRVSSDSHSPLEFRVNGPYPNIDAFHEAFGTQAGDGMWLAPEDRVRIW